jgi:hypothetical protein
MIVKDHGEVYQDDGSPGEASKPSPRNSYPEISYKYRSFQNPEANTKSV